MTHEQLIETWNALPKHLQASFGAILTALANRPKRPPRKAKTAPAWAVEMARFLADKIRANSSVTAKPTPGWARDIDLLHRQDGASQPDIRQAITWATADDFWKRNVLSGNAVRRHFGKLLIGARQAASSDQGNAFNDRLERIRKRQ